MSKVEGKRHIVCRLIRGITEHHTLVTRSLVIGILAFDTSVDVSALLVDRREDAARLRLELILTFRITNFFNHTTGNVLHIDVSPRLNFSSQDNLSGRNKGFASYFRVWIVSQKLVKQSIRYLVGYFIGVSFRHRFGGK